MSAGPYGTPPIQLGAQQQSQVIPDTSIEDALILNGPGPYGTPPFEAPRSGSGGSSTLDGLSDVVITSPADNDVLAYDSASSRWKNRDSALVGHYEVIMAGTGPPPDPVSDMSGTDWLYGWVPG